MSELPTFEELTEGLYTNRITITVSGDGFIAVSHPDVEKYSNSYETAKENAPLRFRVAKTSDCTVTNAEIGDMIAKKF